MARAARERRGLLWTVRRCQAKSPAEPVERSKSIQAAGVNDLFMIGPHHEKAGGNRPAG
jgi:hypothetical protein